MNTAANAVIQTLTDDQLKLIDFIAIIDHSASMGDPSIRRSGMTRFSELQEDTVGIAREAQRFDSDGLTVVAFSSAVRVFDGVTADRVADIFKEFSPRGGTNLAAALEAAFAKAATSSKDCVILVFTDGVPDDGGRVYQVVNSAGQKNGRPKLGITFVQVGEAPEATAFLAKLNNNLSVDIVAVASAKDAEGLTLGQLCWMAQNQ